MKKLLMLKSVYACLLAMFLSISSTHQLPDRMQRETRELERKNKKYSGNYSLLETTATTNGSITIGNSNSSRGVLLNNTGQHELGLNSTESTRRKGCHGEESPAICHTYIRNMYQFYSTIGGFLMLAIVFLGVSFLIITHFHGRHIVKTNQHVVGTIAKWDAIQHRKQQARERNGNWI